MKKKLDFYRDTLFSLINFHQQLKSNKSLDQLLNLKDKDL